MNSMLSPPESPRGARVLDSLADALMNLFGDLLASSGRVDTDAILTTVTSTIAEQIPVTCIAILMKSDPDMSRVVTADRAHPEIAEYTELLTEIRPEANEGYNTLFYERLPATAQRLASNPRDFDAFVEGITLYHIVIEATIALTGQRFELEAMREQQLTDRGFYRGFTALARDESRHVNFGIKVLQEAVREDPQRFAPLIQKTLVECLPLISGTLDPPDPRYITEYGHTES